MARVFNFSAGPSMLPESVLNKAADELLDYEGTGESVRCPTAAKSIRRSSTRRKRTFAPS